jgi:hypothetical protein
MTALGRHARNSTAVSRTLVVALLVTAVLATATFRQRTKLARAAEPATAVRPSQALPPGPVLATLALGHNEALADLLWLNALSHFGLHAWRRNDPDWLDANIEALETVDPRFQLVYEWAGTVLVYGSGFQRDAILKSNEVLLRGTERFPMAWTLWQMLAMNYLVELPRTSRDPEEVAQWRALAIDYLGRAANLPNAPASMRAAALSLYSDQASWNDLLERSTTAYLRADTRSEALTARLHIRNQVAPTFEIGALSDRELRLHLGRHPQLRLRSETAAYAIHPDVLYLYEPEWLVPPPFPHTR